MMKPLLCFLICAALRAGEPLDLRTHLGKTLPAEAYKLLKKGGGRNSFSWSWKDPSFNPGAGYVVAETRWEYDERQGSVLAYLREQLDLQAQGNAPNKLVVKVTYFAVDSIGPQLMLEGTLSTGGKPKAYFVESVILDRGDSLRGLVDEFMQDFTAFMR